MVTLETPWSLGCTPVNIYNKLSIALTEEFLDYVAQNPCKNILQGMARCSKLIDDAMYCLNMIINTTLLFANFAKTCFLKHKLLFMKTPLSSLNLHCSQNQPPVVLTSKQNGHMPSFL